MGTSASLLWCPGQYSADLNDVIQLLYGLSESLGICPNPVSDLGQMWDPSFWGQFGHPVDPGQVWNSNSNWGHSWGSQNTNADNTNHWTSGGSSDTGNTSPWNSGSTGQSWGQPENGADQWGNTLNSGNNWGQPWTSGSNDHGWNNGGGMQGWNTGGHDQGWDFGSHGFHRRKRQAAATCSLMFYDCLRPTPEETCA